MVRKIIWRVFGYLLYAALVTFISVQIGMKSFNGRKGKYQSKYINDWYKNAAVKSDATDEEKKEALINHKRYILEAVSLQGGIMNTTPIWEQEVKESDYTDKGSDIITFKMAVYQVAIPKKSGHINGFVIYFKEFNHGQLKNDGTYNFTDLSFRGGVDSAGNQVPSLFDKKFDFENSLKKEHTFKLTLQFDPQPLLIRNDKTKNRAQTLVVPSNPIFFTEESLIANKTATNENEKISTIKNLLFSYYKDPETDKSLDIVSISNSEYEDHGLAKIKLNNLDLSLSKYKMRDEDVKNAKFISKEKGSEKVAIDELVNPNFVKLSLNKCLNEFNAVRIATISVVVILVLIASYFLFGHKHVMAKVRKNKENKKHEKEDPGFNVDEKEEVVQDADFKEIDEKEETKEDK